MQFVIFHGSFGSVNENWFPWLKQALEKLGHDVILDQYPVDNFNNLQKEEKHPVQSLESWLKFFEKNTLPKLNKNEPIVFVGHSMGPAFILHVVSKFDLQLDSAIFVAPFLEWIDNPQYWQFGVVNPSFSKTDFDWKKLKELIPLSYVLYGENDPYVARKLFLDFAQKTSSSVIPVKNGGHLGGDFKQLPIVLELCKTRIGL